MRTHSGLFIPGAPMVASSQSPIIGRDRKGAPIFASNDDVLIPGEVAGFTRDGEPLRAIAGGATHPAVMDRGNARSRQHPGAPAQPAVAFTRAAHRVVTGPKIDVTRQIDANGAGLGGEFEVPSRGYLRACWLLVTCSGGVLGPGSLHEDWPFNVLDQISLTDPNSVQLFGPMGGFEAAWAAALGAYRPVVDPADLPGFSASINANFAIRVPVEISARTGYGALLNQNADTPFKLNFRQPAASNPVAPTTQPTVRYRMWLEAWTEPTPMDLRGSPQAILPPGHPTYQYWHSTSYNIQQDNFDVQIRRLGRLYRTWVGIYRSGAPLVRNDVWPNDFRFTWDDVDVYQFTDDQFRKYQAETWGSDVGFPTGLRALCWSDEEGKAGTDEDGHLYLPILSGANVQLHGTWNATGKLTVLTNDVAPLRLAQQLAQQQA